MRGDLPLSEMTPEEISGRIDEMEDVLDTLETRPQGTDGAMPQGHYDHMAIRREQMALIDELIRRGLF
jgi:hypothetical protein